MRTFDELQELTVDCICMERNDLNRADIASSVRSYQRIYMWQAAVFLSAQVLNVIMAVAGDAHRTIWIFGLSQVAVPMMLILVFRSISYRTRYDTVRFAFVQSQILSHINSVSVLFMMSDIIFILSCAVYFISSWVVY